MRYALTGTEKCIIWKCGPNDFHRLLAPWRVAMGNNGCPLTTPTRFATWREAMDYATGDR